MPQDGLESLLEVAEDLQVKGLTQENDKKIEAKKVPRAPPAKKFKPARRPSDSSEQFPEEKPIKTEVLLHVSYHSALKLEKKCNF